MITFTDTNLRIGWWSMWHRRVLCHRRLSQWSKPTIKLTSEEIKLFQVLQYIQKQYAPDVTLRVAGGWVRDKLLGIPSDDIDIAVDSGTGESFAQHILSFQSASGVPSKGFYVVKKNTEQSKHLACATVKLLGHDLDFVHLRSETYADSTSRIPILNEKPATPTEDASRRDITINALFYNLATESIEDFTGYGLADLKAKRIRTPLPPLETFLDDPLRVLRAIRFACHYNFTLEADLTEAIQDSRVQEALLHKVSRERIGIEVRKMLSGANPSRAITLLTELGLWHTLLPELTAIDSKDPSSFLSCVKFVQEFAAPPTLSLEDFCMFQDTLSDEELVKICLQYLFQPTWQDHKRYLDAIKDELKWSKAEAKAITNIIEACKSFNDNSTNDKAIVQHIRLILWFRDHGPVFKEAIPILWHLPDKPHTKTKNSHKCLNEIKIDSHPKNYKIFFWYDIVTIERPKKLSDLIEVTAVYETLYPDNTIEEEIEFVQKVLEPIYKRASEQNDSKTYNVYYYSR
ncbi:tRNA nucleotidyltransferase, partial [Thraustotheca clavata]